MHGSLAEDNGGLLSRLLASLRTPATQAAYRSDLADLSRYLEARSLESSLELFAAQPEANIQTIINEYKRALIERGVSIATVNRRLAAVRALLSVASEQGLAETDGRALVRNQRVSAVVPFAGLSGMKLRLLLALPDHGSVRGLRDAVLLRLLYENALRPQEICAAKVADFSGPAEALVTPCGPGIRSVFLSDRCASLLCEYLLAAGHEGAPDAPLLRNLDHRTLSQPAALTAKGIRHILAGYGRQIEVDLTPRLLRRSAISLASEEMGQELSVVQDLLEKQAKERTDPGKVQSMTQGGITQRLSDLVSSSNLIFADAQRLRKRSESLRNHSDATTDRSGWLVKKSQHLQRCMEEQATRWARYEREKQDRAD